MLLEVEGLTKSFRGRSGLAWGRAAPEVHALSDVTFSLRAGETLAIVGESGSGKSTLARCVMRLIDPTAGRIVFDGRDITTLAGRSMRELRRDMSLVFQDPFASLDPRQKVGAIVGEPLRIHGMSDRSAIRERVGELLEVVGLRAEHYNRYPHQFSGGQRQRVGIARALACKPKLIVCDEPVSALDVSVQAQILNLLKDLQQEFGLTYLFISHDLGVIHFVADRVLVMYQGRVVEQAVRDELFASPAHPYTAELLAAVPVPDPDVREAPDAQPPERTSGGGDGTGCAFSSRCAYARAPECHVDAPVLHSLESARQVACHFPLGRGAERQPIASEEPEGQRINE
jgi:oligopeptide transport system ATP-binding protein